MTLYKLWGQCSLLYYKEHVFQILATVERSEMCCRTGDIIDRRSTWKRATACCYTPRPVTLSVDNHLQLHVCQGGARWGSGETRTNIMQHGSSQHSRKVLTLNCKDMSTKEASSPNSLLVEGHDNSIDITKALSWLCCDRVELDDLWKSLPTIQGRCA